MSATANSDNPSDVEQDKYYKSSIKKLRFKWNKFSNNIVWEYLIYLTFFHVGFIVALYSYIFGLHPAPMKGLTLFWLIFYGNATTFGITAGAHRLWTHRCFKAKNSLKIFLMLLYSAAGLYSLRLWIKDHRLHHRYTDTEFDPHNAKRGLLYSHWGWLVTKRTPKIIEKAREIDMSDIRADPVVMFQDQYWMTLGLLLSFVLPTAIPVIFWAETFLHAILTQCFIRYVCQLNAMFSVNSFAHYWGYRPYNRFITAVENPFISMLVLGEASHNYHHIFPSDYKATEFPFVRFNFTAVAIRALAALGLAYDLKEPSPELVKRVKECHGPGKLESNDSNDR